MFNSEFCLTEASQQRIGWLCSYVPEELILAAGYASMRLSSRERTPEGAESFLPANICPYVRSICNAVISGDFEGIEGIVLALSCDAMRRLADIWIQYRPPKFSYRLDVPRRSDELAEQYFVNQLQGLLSALERESGKTVSDHDLVEAISIVNHKRELVGQISRLRDSSEPKLSATEFYEVTRTAMCSDIRRFNAEAQHLLDNLETGASANSGKTPRLMLCGCVVDAPSLISQIEDCGALVVVDDLCTSLRHFDGLVDTTLEPLLGIARRYLKRAACARMAGASQRVQRVLSLAKEHRVDGIVFHTLKFCDLVQADLPRTRFALENAGIPILHIERDYSSAPGGQLRTRVEAFVELLNSQRVEA